MILAIVHETASRYRIYVLFLFEKFQKEGEPFFSLAANAIIQIQVIQPITGIIIEARSSQDDGCIRFIVEDIGDLLDPWTQIRVRRTQIGSCIQSIIEYQTN